MKILVILFVVLICFFANYLNINVSSSCSNNMIEVILLLYKCTNYICILQYVLFINSSGFLFECEIL
jgi:hypothetical protein